MSIMLVALNDDQNEILIEIKSNEYAVYCLLQI